MRCTGGSRVRPRGQHRARHDEPLRPNAVGPDRALRAHRGRQPRDIVQAQSLEPRAEHHHHQRLLAAAEVRGLVHSAVPEVRSPAPAAAAARPGHRLVGLPRLGHHDARVHQTGERPREMARTVRHRFAHLSADRQRHIHQSNHITAIRQREHHSILS